MDSSSYDGTSTLFVDIHNLSQGGVLIECSRELDVSSHLFLLRYSPCLTEWEEQPVRAAWVEKSVKTGQYLMGLEFLPVAQTTGDFNDKIAEHPSPQPSDLSFLLNTPFFGSLPRGAACHLLNCLSSRTFKGGEKLITQGDEADDLYLIQKGECSVSVELNEQLTQIARLREGDVVGEMAVLTGQPRNAHVHAETDMKVWALGKKQFEEVSAAFPDLRYFLTELLTHRFESQPLYGDRSIGRYIIRRMIGKGGWSIVYHGVHQTLNFPVAVKMLKHTMAMEPGFMEKFRDEAKVIAQLSHKNIVHVYDIEELYRTMFIVMEYLEGQSLEDILKHTGALPIPRTVDFLVQICKGLAYAHEKGIIHQDIKPANLFLLQDGQIKILDFGLACTSGSEDLGLCGTIYYAAPEQLEGTPLDAQTDLYALGLTAFEMVTGKRPFPEDDLNALVEMHLNEDIPDPAAMVPDLPEPLRRFILKACQRSRSLRYGSVVEGLQDLLPLHQQYLSTVGGTAFEKRKLTSLTLLYRDEHQVALNQLLEDFGNKLEDLGVMIKTATFEVV